MYDELLATLPRAVERGWEADDATLTCPCGHTIEPDGSCPDGCVSPLRSAGLI